MIKKFSFLRPRDIAVEALVSDNTQEMDFYIIQNDVLSTSESENLALAKEENLEYQTLKVVPRTLTSILDEYQAPKDIDILSIDAEEHDYNVLNSLDFNRYIPKLIIVEDETFDISNPGKNRINNLLLGKGYILLGFILKNLYFRKKD